MDRSSRGTEPILLVEDKDSLRTMLRLALEAQGYAVIEARDETEARSALGQSLPSVVLSDLRLPTGDGFGVLRAAKDADPDLPVIVMTAYGSIQDAVSAMKDFARVHRAGPSAATLSTLTVSNLGRMLPFEELSLAADAEYRCASLPEGPSGVTVWLAQLGRRCTATATFCPAVIDHADVAFAIELLTSDPVALLEGN